MARGTGWRTLYCHCVRVLLHRKVFVFLPANASHCGKAGERMTVHSLGDTAFCVHLLHYITKSWTVLMKT